MRRTQEGYSPFKDDKPKDTENSPFEASSVLVVKAKIYSVGTFGGAGANTLAKGRFDYDNCRADYLESLNKLRKKKVDVFIGNHVWNNDTEAKAKVLKETGENQFIDGKLWGEFLDFCEKRLQKVSLD